MTADEPLEDDRLVAAVFRAALSLGIATPADLVPWADTQVLARERPAGWILDLSIGAAVPADQTSVMLHDVAERADQTAVFRFLVGLIDGFDTWSYEQSRHADEWLWVVAQQWGPKGAFDQINGIDDGFFLMHYEQMGDPTALKSQVVAFVRQHADPTARAWLPGVRVTFQ